MRVLLHGNIFEIHTLDFLLLPRRSTSRSHRYHRDSVFLQTFMLLFCRVRIAVLAVCSIMDLQLGSVLIKFFKKNLNDSVCVLFAMGTSALRYVPVSRRRGRETHDDDWASRRNERKAPGVREGSDLSGSGDLTYKRTVSDRYRMYTSSTFFLSIVSYCHWIFYG